MPLAAAEEDIRRSTEAVLHVAWLDSEARLSISNMLGLCLKGMSLRSGKRTPRCQAQGSRACKRWLIWEEVAGEHPPPAPDARAVGALVLSRYHADKPGIAIGYVAAIRSRGGRGWPMVLAAEAIARLEGLGVLYSAADLSQDGGGGAGLSAKEAHARWGFEACSEEEWRAAGLELYDSTRCTVAYTKKSLARIRPASAH